MRVTPPGSDPRAAPTVYVTARRDSIKDLAAFPAEQRLAARVNVVDCKSYCRWEGAVDDGYREAVPLAKTTAEQYPAPRHELAAEHPNHVPCIECFDEAEALDAYAG